MLVLSAGDASIFFICISRAKVVYNLTCFLFCYGHFHWALCYWYFGGVFSDVRSVPEEESPTVQSRGA